MFEGTRQLGKSTLACVALIDGAINNAGAELAYVDMDQLHGEKVLWRDVDTMLEKYDIPHNPRIVDGALRFDNGAVVYIFSGRPAEIEKLQGISLALLIVDEAQECADL